MKRSFNYQQQKKINFTLKIRERLKELPPYVGKYARGIEPLTSDNTRYSYLSDLQVFFYFLITSKPEFVDCTMKDVTLEYLEELTIFDIEEYQEYLKFYCSPTGQWYQNGERGVARKIASLRSFFYYLHQHDLITKNPMLKVSTPKIHEKEIIHLDEEEIVALIEHIKHANIRYKSNRKRDALFLSMQQKRLGVRSVENLVKKYASTITSLKKITPHKLRSTYGTRLYQETEDIYLVADVLGHKDVNTTKKHYAAQDEKSRRRAANAVPLRKVDD